jgi:hypothetical protein
VHLRQGIQRVVKLVGIQMMVCAVLQNAVKRYAALFSAPFLGFPAACVLDQDLAHGPGHFVHQTGTVGVRADLAVCGESKPGFMDKGGGLKGMPLTLASHRSRCHSV